MSEKDIKKAFGFEQKEIEHEGKKYTLQNVPLKVYYKMIEDATSANGNILSTVMYDSIFDKVVISPKTTWEDFDTPKSLDEFMNKVNSFLRREEE